jgi:hypothetical protein
MGLSNQSVADAVQGIIRAPAATLNVKQTIVELRVGRVRIVSVVHLEK